MRYVPMVLVAAAISFIGILLLAATIRPWLWALR
jgi:hypothetical protein